MTVTELRVLRDRMQKEDPFSRVALKEISNPGYIRKQLQAEFSKHLKAKENMDKLVDRIQQVAKVDRNRAKLIAQSEKTKALSGGRFAAIVDPYLEEYDKAVRMHRKRPERPKHQWVEPMVAKHPRHDHIGISGKVVYVGEEFFPGLRLPGDPDAPINQTANCHCYTRRIRG